MSEPYDNIKFSRVVKQLKTKSAVEPIVTRWDLNPQKIGDEIMLAGWRMNVRSFIHPDAMAEDILDGWNYLSSLGVHNEVLSLVLFCKALLESNDLRTTNEEPELFELLRLSFWINKCKILFDIGKLDSSFNYKLDELKKEIGQGIETLANTYQIPLISNYPIKSREYTERIHKILYCIARRRAPSGFISFLDKIRSSVSSAASEFMLYALVVDLNYRVSFVKNDPNMRTPDTFLNTIPTEVKTVLDIIECQTKIEGDLYSEVLGTLKRTKIIEDIDYALTQNARIVVLNVTTISFGFALSLYSSNNKIDLNISDAIFNSLYLIEKKIKNIVPVVVVAGCIDKDKKYRISAICLKCPVKNSDGTLAVDVQKIPDH